MWDRVGLGRQSDLYSQDGRVFLCVGIWDLVGLFGVGVSMLNTRQLWGGISLVHMVGVFGQRRFGIFRVDCKMDGSYCLVHLKSGLL